MARYARLAAEELPPVRLALSHVRMPTDSAPGSARDVWLEMTVVAEYGEDLRAVAQEVRARVVDRVRAVTGTAPVGVSVHVDDVLQAHP